jgi:hypothetical protein
MNGFLTNDFDMTGRSGIIIDIGKKKKTGMSKATNLNPISSEKN